MFLIKAGTKIKVNAPNGVLYSKLPENQKQSALDNLASWKPYTTQKDKLYDNDQVWDAVAVFNKRDDVPVWAVKNIIEFACVIVNCEGNYAMVDMTKMEYID
jgi:hypothetical protein